MSGDRQPWERVERSWNALGRVRQELVEAANMATAEAATAKHVTKEQAAFSYQRGRSDALFEAERMIRDAMEVEDA